MTASTQKVILILAANPINTPALRLEEEIREIDEGLKRAKIRDGFILEYKLAVRPKDVQRAILDYNPNIVHFCGHSTTEGIAFDSDTGEAQLVSADALAGLFELFSDTIEVVVLNSCYSESQAIAIASYIDYVVGMSKEIGDKTAVKFSIGFYDGLGAGKDIEFSYKLGCNSIQLSGFPEHLTPVLLQKGEFCSMHNKKTSKYNYKDEISEIKRSLEKQSTDEIPPDKWDFANGSSRSNWLNKLFEDKS